MGRLIAAESKILVPYLVLGVRPLFLVRGLDPLRFTE